MSTTTMRLILIFIMLLSFSAGKAYCMMAVKSSTSSVAAEDKGATATSSETTAGKAQTTPGSKSSATKIHATTEVTTDSIIPIVTKQHFLLEKVEGNTFYTKDGNKVVIPSSVRIINNTRNGEVYNAELTYVNGQLIEAMIR